MALSTAWLESVGLSRREAEVLFWVAQGKTNPEVAMILGISPRTVRKIITRNPAHPKRWWARWPAVLRPRPIWR